MNHQLLQPRKTLNKAFLKIKPNRTQIEVFKSNLIQVLDGCNAKESEEFHKNLVSDFLKNTYYSPHYFINTKGRNDLVIHNGKDAKASVGVVIEAKSPTNKSEMISVENLNGKALQELVLYFLRERISHKNLEIKHLVVTNIYEWFVFDAQVFEKQFAQNKSFVKQFEEFESKQLSGIKTDFFYKDIAKPFIETLKNEIEFTYFDFRNYDKPLRNADKEDDKSLVALFKLLSPEHLLKLSFANDSNSLDKNFYSELLHIIGLTETKEGGKKLIQRHEKASRNEGSLLENAIMQLDSLDKISRLQNPKLYGENYEERLFNVALELTITWVNRILFLKLLEAQLISYHRGNKSYSFLNVSLINDYDKLNKLFFQVLAKKPSDRNNDVMAIYAKVPYLNSSLFEPTDLEHDTLFISNLEDEIPLQLLTSTVIKDGQGKKETGTKNALHYFFSFLDAYDFASEGSEDIQEDNKTLINASVLGLIFEKINGYKDGSFFTPGFITMYMCKETIRRAVVQKFNETKGWNCETINDIYNKITDSKEANTIVNSIKICDPAVGSGHFLVSALNEIIVIKHDLGILQDENGKKLRDYSVEIVNDELIISNDDGVPFQYNPNNKESQRIQETLFKEKTTIIENCLFGVDINPNSVKICRLRLWIELLKNAYYIENREKNKENRLEELETLPNIDINIKCGNSLISRFGLDTDLKVALKQSKWNIESYKNAVATYRNAESKEQKREMEHLINDIKGNFRSEISINDPKKLTLEKKKGELFNYTQQVGLFERSKKEQTEWNKKVNTLADEIKKLETDIEEIKSNRIYENAFEWRFEFPEVLNDDGDFVGFDVVIGNPPYIFSRELITESDKLYFYNKYTLTQFKLNTYILFSELAFKLTNKYASVSYIIPNNWLTLQNNSDFREFLLNISNDIIIVNDKNKTFEDASVDASIFITSKYGKPNLKAYELINKDFNLISDVNKTLYINSNGSIINYSSNSNPLLANIISKINSNSNLISEHFDVKNGVQAYTVGEGTPKLTKEMKDNRVYHSDEKKSNDWIKYIDGSDVKRYYLDWSKTYILYGKNLSRPRIPELFNEERIYVRQIPTKPPYSIVSTYIDIDAVCDNNHMILKSNENSNYSLLKLSGILNSRLISFWFISTFAKDQRKLFPQFKINELKTFPIPKNDSEILDKIELNVVQILTLKKENPQADTSVLEREIDLMVYELYGLSEEEIGIVEGS